jgi:hypothetical protein
VTMLRCAEGRASACLRHGESNPFQSSLTPFFGKQAPSGTVIGSRPRYRQAAARGTSHLKEVHANAKHAEVHALVPGKCHEGDHRACGPQSSTGDSEHDRKQDSLHGIAQHRGHRTCQHARDRTAQGSSNMTACMGSHTG